MTAEPRPRFSQRFPRATENNAIWLVAIVGLSLSVAALLLMRQQLDAHQLLDFEWEAHNRIRALSHGIDTSMLAVATVRDHILASEKIEPEGFRRYSESVIKRNPAIEALLWVPVVQQADRAASSSAFSGSASCPDWRSHCWSRVA